jgi:Cu(I)/Ag(I) efflux system membrane protein CusA/SilA
MPEDSTPSDAPKLTMAKSPSWLDRVLRFTLENKLVVFIGIVLVIIGGLYVAPFDWNFGWFPRDPVPIDALPDIGENQQIVFTDWPGRSAQDVENQVTYPLTVAFLGVPEVKAIRSISMFGFSTIYVVFKDPSSIRFWQERGRFYWCRSRVLERLSSLPPGSLPTGVQPKLGPDATALGQVFWYTIEGRDAQGKPTGGWGLDELRTIQDWYVRFPLQSAEGVSEVASVGGFVKEYQVDVDPDAMRTAGVSLEEVVQAVRMSNLDVGARTIEVNRVEYVIRGIGFVKNLADVENAVVKTTDNVPIFVKNVAHVTLGPAERRGVLNKEGAESVGGVVVVRFAENPLAAIKNVKARINEISSGLPSKTLPDGTVSQVKIVPYYDRTGLIYETLGTLSSAIFEEILITIIVILVMVVNLRSSFLVSGLLPLAVLITFMAMKVFHIDANIVALSGIAIAIGTMVDVGIVMTENILRHLEKARPEDSSLEIVYRATSEVGSAVMTAIATTIVGFLPVFTMQGAEGKLFKPLAFTKTFALFASLVVALTVIPPLAHILLGTKFKSRSVERALYIGLVVLGVILAFTVAWWVGVVVVFMGAYQLGRHHIPERFSKWLPWLVTGFAVLVVAVILTAHWEPLGPDKGLVRNSIFVAVVVGALLGFYEFFRWKYQPILRWCLNHRKAFLSIPVAIILFGVFVWLGFGAFFGWLPQSVKSWKPVTAIATTFPGLGKEFMPPLDEGSFLYMPSLMTHASVGEATDILAKQNSLISQIPEIEVVAGKAGRIESALDPAPISMIETVINYKPRYLIDRDGKILTFRWNPKGDDFFRSENGVPLPAPDGSPYKVPGHFERDGLGKLIPETNGKPFLLWRPPLEEKLNPNRQPWPGIHKSDDIWNEITAAAQMPGVTSAPKLQPIATRLVMLQSGLRSSFGVKITGPDNETIEKVGIQIERFLKELTTVIKPSTVIADRIVGKPYLEININRQAIARYGIMLNQMQEAIMAAVGGELITTTVEGRERYPVRVRYERELRDSIEALGKILISAADGSQIPIIQLADIKYVRGPEMIKSENTALVGYVLFDKQDGVAEVNAVEAAQKYLAQKEADGSFVRPPGVNYVFAGEYQNQISAQRTLEIILPISLVIIFLILYFQFASVVTTSLVWSGIMVAWAGGFLMIWLYAQSWFLDFSIFGTNMKELFQVHPFNLSVAVWVGFLALFGIAADDGIIMATYLNQSFARNKPSTLPAIQDAVVEAGMRRVRPCLMTTATTVIALIPVLTSAGRGSDIMVPMAIPSFGGMVIQTITMLIVPVLYSMKEEWKLRRSGS